MKNLQILSSQVTFSSPTCQLLKQSSVYYDPSIFYNEMLSWMIGIRMKSQLVSDNICNIITIFINLILSLVSNQYMDHNNMV